MCKLIQKLFKRDVKIEPINKKEMEGRLENYRKKSVNGVLFEAYEKAEYQLSEFVSLTNPDMRKLEEIGEYLKNRDFSNGLLQEEDIMAFAILMVEFISSQVESIHSSLNNIKLGQHDDRIAALESALYRCQRDLKEVDVDERKRKIDEDRNELEKVLEQIKLEMKREHLNDVFSKVPKSPFKKLFCGISLSDIKSHLWQMQESFIMYEKGLFIILIIENLYYSNEELSERLIREKQYIEEMENLEGYRRLKEIDDENRRLWYDHHKLIRESIDGILKIQEVLESEKVLEQIGEKL